MSKLSLPIEVRTVIVSTWSARIILYVSTFAWLLALIPALFGAWLCFLLSFDAPDSVTSPFAWVIRVVILASPFGLIHTIKSSWNYFDRGGRNLLLLCFHCFCPLLFIAPYVLELIYYNIGSNQEPDTIAHINQVKAPLQLHKGKGKTSTKERVNSSPAHKGRP